MDKKEEDYIKNFNKERNIKTKFLILKKEIKKTKVNKPYLNLLLHDKTGNIEGKMFSGNPLKMSNKINVNEVYNVVGSVNEYPKGSNKYNILINDIIKSKNYNMENFQQKVINLDSHVNYLFDTIKEIKNKELQKLLVLIFEDEKIKEQFINAPAAVIHHHNYKGGLLVHTNEVIEICKCISNIYEDVDRDLLLTGAILHDIGKIETYDVDGELITFNEKGKLIDHIFIGTNLVKEMMNKINMSEDLQTKVVHLLLSHHGDKELGWGSPVNPLILEAVILHHADDMSAKITGFLQKK